MADNSNRKGRNPFATALTYTPLLGAVGMGGWSVYQEIEANRSVSGTTANDAAARASRSIGSQRFAAKAAVESSLDAGKMLQKSLGGSFGPDSVKRLAFAYAATIADPTTSLNKQNMLQALFEAQSMSQQALGAGGDRSAYVSHMQRMIGGLGPRHASTMWKKWQMLSPGRLDDYIGRGPDRILDRDFYGNLGFLSQGKSRVVPDSFTRNAASPANTAQFLKKHGLHELNINATLHYLTGPGGRKFQELGVQYGGSKRNFRFIFGQEGMGKTTGVDVVSPKGMSIFSMGHVHKGGMSLNEQLADQIHLMSNQAGSLRSKTYRQFYEGLRQKGQFGSPNATPGEALRMAIARNTVWDPAAAQPGQHYDSSAMAKFMSSNRTMEAVAPGTLTKGGFMDMKNFRTAGGNTYDLRNLFKDQGSFSREVRLFQFMRDLSWAPTEHARAHWGLKSPSDLRDASTLRNIRMGPGGALQRFLPVTATKTFEDVMVKEFGYVTPGSVTLHVLGDGDPNARIPGMIRRWGMRDGESFVRDSFTKYLSSQRTVAYDILAGAGSPVSLDLTPGARAAMEAGTLSPGALAADLRTQIAEKGGIKLTQDQVLGLGSGPQSGNLIKSSPVPGVRETITGATLSHEGYLRLHVRQDIDFIDTMKFFGGTKTTGKMRSDRQMRKDLGQVQEAMDVADNALNRIGAHIDQITNTSMIGKHAFAAHEQMVSGLRVLAGHRYEELIDQRWRSEQSVGRRLRGLNGQLSSLLANDRRLRRTKIAPKLKKLQETFSYLERTMSQMYEKNPVPGKILVNPATEATWTEGGKTVKGRQVNATWVDQKGKAPRHILSIDPQVIQRRRSLEASIRNQATALKKLGERLPQTKEFEALRKTIWDTAQMGADNYEAATSRINVFKKFLAQDPGGLYLTSKGNPRKNIPLNVARAAKQLGLEADPLIGTVFGGMHHYLSKAKSPALAGYEGMLEKVLGSKALGLSQPKDGYYLALGQTFNYQGDAPHLAQGRVGSVESRNLDMILSRQIRVGGENLTEALIKDIYGATASPTAIKDYNAISRMMWSMTGDAVPDAALPRVPLNSQNLADITQADWFKGHGAVVEMPKELHADLKARGLATEWEVPGMRSISPGFALDDEVKTAGYARTQGGELQAKTYRGQVQKMFELLAPDSFHRDMPMEAKMSAILMGSEDMNMTGVTGLWRTAKKGLIRNKLGPGSSYGQAFGLPAVQDILGNMVAGDVAGIGKGIGAELSQGNTIFVSRMLAKRLLSEIEGSGITLPGMADKEAYEGFRSGFLKGERSWFGVVGRMPAAYQSSIQPTRIAVYQGGATNDIENIKIAENLVDVMVNGVKKTMNLGLGPGMGLDFDKDMLFVKMLTDGDGVRIMSQPGAMQDIARQAQTIQVWQDFVNDEVVSQMTKHVKGRPDLQAQETSRISQTKKLFHSKDVGRISKALEEVKYAFLTEEMDEGRRSKVFSILSAIEEAATLKSRKLPVAVNLGEEVVEALYGGKGGARTMDPNRFVDKIEDVFRSDAMEKGIDISIDGKSTHMAWGEADSRSMVNILNAYKNDTGGIRREVFNLSRTKRRMSFESTVGAARYAMKHSISAEDSLARLVSDYNKTGSLRGMAEELIADLNINTKQLGKYKKTMGGAAVAGLAGTALMQSFMGGPGYAGTPLGGEAGLDPRLLQHVEQGSMLNMPSSQPTPQSVMPQQMAPRSGAIHTPTARMSSTGTTSRARVRGDSGAAHIDQAISEYRRRRPGANVRTRITDNRRPLYPSQIDHY